jgi:hypothetical protein
MRVHIRQVGAPAEPSRGRTCSGVELAALTIGPALAGGGVRGTLMGVS